MRKIIDMLKRVNWDLVIGTILEYTVAITYWAFGIGILVLMFVLTYDL